MLEEAANASFAHYLQALREKFSDLPGPIILEDQASVIAGALPVEGMQTLAVNFFEDQPVKGESEEPQPQSSTRKELMRA